jgi:hypothetical protein
MSKVVKAQNGCWNWTGALSGSGYAQVQMWPKVQRGHRISYEHFVGPIPKGMLLRHSCDNKICINPDHLIPGTKVDNGRDAVERGQFKPKAKLTYEQVLKIIDDPRPQTHIAKEYGVNPSAISNIKRGKRWARRW